MNDKHIEEIVEELMESLLNDYTSLTVGETINYKLELRQALTKVKEEERERFIAYTIEYDITQMTEEELREALTSKI